MRVNIVDVCQVQLRIRQGALHSPGSTFAVWRISYDMICVGGSPIARQPCINRRASLLGVFQTLKHQHRSSFAHDEAVSVGIERPAGSLWLIVAGGHRFHGTKTGHSKRRNRGFRSAGQHYLGLSVLNEPQCLAQSMGAGSAGGDHRSIRSFSPKTDRHLS